MKQLLLALLLFSEVYFAQYKKFPLDTNHYWIEKYNDLHPTNPNNCTYQYSIIKDTLIATKKYQKIIISNKVFAAGAFSFYSPNTAFIRQDTLQKRVYVLDNSYSDRKLYDFKKNVGDTVIVFTPWGLWANTTLTLTVSGIDSVMCSDGYYRRRHNYGFIGGDAIEGIGGRHGLLTPYMANAVNTSFGSAAYLKCVGSKNPVSTVYSVFGLSGNCGMDVSINEPFLNYKINVLPNPAEDNLYLKGLSNTDWIQSLDAINILGDVIKLKWYKDEVDISNLQPGFYILKINGSSNSHIIKFVKEN